MSASPVTVFGGSGFLGRAIVRELVDAGHTVRIAARHPALPEWADDGDRLETIAADIRNDGDVAQALDGAQGVVNAVSLYVQRRQVRFADIHVEGAARLARLAREADIGTLVQISGIGASQRSRSAYVRARADGEIAVMEYFPKAAILRPSVLFGPDDAFLNTLSGLTRLPAIPLFGDGTVRLQPVHVIDVARAVGRLFAAAPPARRLFELGGPDVMHYRDILALVMAHRQRERRLVPVPFSLWHLLATGAAILPNPPLTQDQVILMREDNIVSENVGTFEDLGILPRSLRESLPTCIEVG